MDGEVRTERRMEGRAEGWTSVREEIQRKEGRIEFKEERKRSKEKGWNGMTEES